VNKWYMVFANAFNSPTGQYGMTLSADKVQTLYNNNWLGRSATGSNALYVGSLDEVRIFDRALSIEEAGQLLRYSGDTYTPVLPITCAPSCSGATPYGHCTAAGVPVCCGSGTYFVDGLHTACQTCPAGTYGFGNATSCTACAAGTSSAAGASACTGCPANSFVSAGDQRSSRLGKE
jgi:hypothetical protein